MILLCHEVDFSSLLPIHFNQLYFAADFLREIKIHWAFN